jgi:hypothetical protein
MRKKSPQWYYYICWQVGKFEVVLMLMLVPRDGSKPRLFLQDGARWGLVSWPSDAMAYILTHTFGR